jgi:hypothetical protein
MALAFGLNRVASKSDFNGLLDCDAQGGVSHARCCGKCQACETRFWLSLNRKLFFAGLCMLRRVNDSTLKRDRLY